MSTKHTPGPWRVVQCTSSDPAEWRYEIASANDTDLKICTPLTSYESGELVGEYLANANLITAAPDLLEGALLLKNLMTEHGDDFKIQAKGMAETILADSMIQKFMAGISKATGGTK